MPYTSCGLFVIDKNNKFVVGHPTGSPPPFWSIPKGKVEEGETHWEAAVRETIEEVGLDINDFKYTLLGESELIKYQKRSKYIKVFFVKIDEDLSNFPFRCDSYCTHNNKQEMDKFHLIHIRSDFSYDRIHETQVQCLNSFLESFDLEKI